MKQATAPAHMRFVVAFQIQPAAQVQAADAALERREVVLFLGYLPRPLNGGFGSQFLSVAPINGGSP